MNNAKGKDRLQYWTICMHLDCETQKQIDIVSSGDWSLNLYSSEAQELGRPIYEILKDYKLQRFYNWHYDEQKQSGPLKMEAVISRNQECRRSLGKVHVEIEMSEEEFKSEYGFWEIKDFYIYDQCGNYSFHSFEASGKHYVGRYWTS